MLFGHNTDVKVGDAMFHVQTEDRGVATAVIDTTVYCRGRVVHRCTSNYQDLLPLQSEAEPALRARIDGQHNAVIEKARSGEFAAGAMPGAPEKEGEPATLNLELLNAKDWLAGKAAHLHVAVRDKSGAPLAGATVAGRMEGLSESGACSAQTGSDGAARLDLELPLVAVPEAAVILDAQHGKAKAQLKFSLRTKAKQPV